MVAENRNGHYAPAERRNRDHEILTSPPGRLSPLDTLCNIVHDLVCTHQRCIVAPYGRCADDLRSVQILRLIQSAALRLLRSANVLVVSQFCIRLAAAPELRARASTNNWNVTHRKSHVSRCRVSEKTISSKIERKIFLKVKYM